MLNMFNPLFSFLNIWNKVIAILTSVLVLVCFNLFSFSSNGFYFPAVFACLVGFDYTAVVNLAPC